MFCSKPPLSTEFTSGVTDYIPGEKRSKKPGEILRYLSFYLKYWLVPLKLNRSLWKTINSKQQLSQPDVFGASKRYLTILRASRMSFRATPAGIPKIRPTNKSAQKRPATPKSCR